MGMGTKRRTAGKEIKKLFYQIQTDKYLYVARKTDYGDEEEVELVNGLIEKAWKNNIFPELKKLSSYPHNKLAQYFESLEIKFPVIPEENPLNDDYNEFEDYSEDEELAEIEDLFDMGELGRSDENGIEEIPDEAQEDVAMLMLAFPALQAIGFPVEKFAPETKDVALNEKQRAQVNWALALGYAIAEMVDGEGRKGKGKTTQMKNVRDLALEYLNDEYVEDVIEEIRNTYKWALKDLR